MLSSFSFDTERAKLRARRREQARCDENRRAAGMLNWIQTRDITPRKTWTPGAGDGKDRWGHGPARKLGKQKDRSKERNFLEATKMNAKSSTEQICRANCTRHLHYHTCTGIHAVIVIGYRTTTLRPARNTGLICMCPWQFFIGWFGRLIVSRWRIDSSEAASAVVTKIYKVYNSRIQRKK